MERFACRSAALKMPSRWSGVPESTPTSHVPQMPSSQDEASARPARRSARENGLVLRNLQHPSRLGELDAKRSAGNYWTGGRCEAFEMHELWLPRCSGCEERVEHRGRSATVEVRAGDRRCDDALDVEHATRLIVDVNQQPRRRLFEPVEQREIGP